MKELVEKIEILLKGIVSMSEFDLNKTTDRDKIIIFKTRKSLAEDMLDFIRIHKNNVNTINKMKTKKGDKK